MLRFVLGIVLAILIVITLVIAIAYLFFSRNANQEAEKLFNNLKIANRQIERSDLKELPPIVQKWMENSGVIGQPAIQALRMKKAGLMRTNPKQKWMYFTDEQYFRVDQPGFIWKAKVKAAPFMFLVGKDKYEKGHGEMLIKLFSLLKVADARGPETDQGTLLRYLAESVWFPSAALNSYISWEEIDDCSARATMSYKGVTASGIFKFNQDGQPTGFEAKRYMESKGDFSLENWCTYMKDYKVFDGITIPAQADIVWKLDSGDFHWYHVEVKEAEYNEPSVY